MGTCLSSFRPKLLLLYRHVSIDRQHELIADFERSNTSNACSIIASLRENNSIFKHLSIPSPDIVRVIKQYLDISLFCNDDLDVYIYLLRHTFPCKELNFLITPFFKNPKPHLQRLKNLFDMFQVPKFHHRSLVRKFDYGKYVGQVFLHQVIPFYQMFQQNGKNQSFDLIKYYMENKMGVVFNDHHMQLPPTEKVQSKICRYCANILIYSRTIKKYWASMPDNNFDHLDILTDETSKCPMCDYTICESSSENLHLSFYSGNNSSHSYYDFFKNIEGPIYDTRHRQYIRIK